MNCAEDAEDEIKFESEEMVDVNAEEERNEDNQVQTDVEKKETKEEEEENEERVEEDKKSLKNRPGTLALKFWET